MRVNEFLKDKIGAICLIIFLVITIEIFLLPFYLPLWVHLYIGGSILVVYGITLLLEYQKKKTFYQTIQENIEQLDKKYLLLEMVKKPDFQEGNLLVEILQETGKSMAEHVNLYQFEQEEYKEYIELWIHEIKTPIAVSKMIIENNRNGITNSMEEEVEKIDHYVEQALFYARSNHTQKDYLINVVSLQEMVNEVVINNKKSFISKNIKLELENLELEVYTDQKWMIFILQQVLDNSIKYKKEQDACLKISARQEKEKTILFIRDNGIGIPKKEVGKVFEKGFTGSNGRKNSKATGIGLYLCKKLCDKLGHGIEITAEEKEGTEVKIIFPQGSFTNLK